MDKIVSKKILKECGVPVAAYLAFNKAEKSTIDFDKIVEATRIAIYDKVGKSRFFCRCVDGEGKGRFRQRIGRKLQV
jgi:phosphoribosylaminoimidazole carboxylase (NCAIR synthetase)